MPMKPVPGTSRPLSTLLHDASEGRTLIRVSLWIDPEALEIEADPQGDETTIPVLIRRGRQEIRGKIDRRAYKVYQTQSMPQAESAIPMPTDNGSRQHREQMYR